MSLNELPEANPGVMDDRTWFFLHNTLRKYDSAISRLRSGATSTNGVDIDGLPLVLSASNPGSDNGYTAWVRESDSALMYSNLTTDSVLAISPLTTKGDLWGFSTLNSRVAIGTDSYVLTADSEQGTGVAWEAIPTPTVHDSDSAAEAVMTVGDTSVETLKTVTLSGGTLAANGDIATFHAGGRVEVAVGGAGRLVQFKFGGTVLGSLTFTQGLHIWVGRVEVIRTGAATQIGIVHLTAVDNGATTTARTSQVRTAAAETLSGDVTCLIQGRDLNSEDDIKCDYFYVVPRVQ